MDLKLLGKLSLIGFFSISYLNVLCQERFNIRNPIELESVVFKGVEETANHYVVTCNGVQITGNGNDSPYAFARFNSDGSYLDKKTYSLETGFSIILSSGGLNYLNDELEYVSIGQEQFTGLYKGFLVSFDEEGDTLQYIQFFSPYYEEFESDFMGPVSICNSTNSDNSVFISTNILQPEAGSTGGDFYIQRMAPDGEVLWEYIYATDAQPETCNALLPTDNGGGFGDSD